MQTDYTHITMILDRSGSMDSVQDDTIGGFNAFLKDQQTQPGHATLSLVQFDDQYERLHDFAPIGTVAELSRATFQPRGSTALLDAMGRAIHETGRALSLLPEDRRPAKVIVVTLTDGYENASRKFTRQDIFSQITHQREHYAWEFVFIGANQDAISTGESIGIQASHAITYAPTAAGQQDIMRKMSRGVARKRQEAAEYAESPLRAAPAAPAAFFTQEDRDTLPDLAPNTNTPGDANDGKPS